MVYIIFASVVLVISVAIFLPSIPRPLGFHPDYDGKQYNLVGKKALIVKTSHGILNKLGETAGRVAGVFASEMTIPCYEFLDGKISIDVASLKLGEIL